VGRLTPFPDVKGPTPPLPLPAVGGLTPPLPLSRCGVGGPAPPLPLSRRGVGGPAPKPLPAVGGWTPPPLSRQQSRLGGPAPPMPLPAVGRWTPFPLSRRQSRLGGLAPPLPLSAVQCVNVVHSGVLQPVVASFCRNICSTDSSRNCMLETFRLQLESAIKYRMESYARALNTLGTEGSVNWSRVQPRAN